MSRHTLTDSMIDETATHPGSPPPGIHLNWVTQKWVSLDVHEDTSTNTPLPILLSKIVDFIDEMGGLHPHITELLKQYEISLPALLAAFWVQNPLRYENDPQCVLWAVSKTLYGKRYYFTDRMLSTAANLAKRYVPPVREGVLPPVTQHRDDKPSVQRKPAPKKQSATPVAPTVRKAVLICAEQDRLEADEFKMHALPLLYGNNIVLSDVVTGQSGLSQLLDADLVITLCSENLFNEYVQETPLAGKAIAFMEERGMQDKTFAVRLHGYRQSNSGYFADIEAVPRMSLRMINDRCTAWMQIVRSIGEKLGVQDVSKKYPLLPAMAGDAVRQKAYKELIDMFDEDFLAVVAAIKPSGFSFDTVSRPQQVAKLIIECFAMDMFRELYRAVEYRLTPRSLRHTFASF